MEQLPKVKIQDNHNISEISKKKKRDVLTLPQQLQDI